MHSSFPNLMKSIIIFKISLAPTEPSKNKNYPVKYLENTLPGPCFEKKKIIYLKLYE